MTCTTAELRAQEPPNVLRMLGSSSDDVAIKVHVPEPLSQDLDLVLASCGTHVIAAPEPLRVKAVAVLGTADHDVAVISIVGGRHLYVDRVVVRMAAARAERALFRGIGHRLASLF